jgi:ketosteroid isomerase-like protein
MSESHNRTVVDRMVEVIRTGDFERMRELMHPDVVQEMPQSGERIRGIDNLIATYTMRPEQFEPEARRAEVVGILGDEPHYVMTPTFNLVRVEGDGDALTVIAKSRYPDGSDWFVISILSFRDGKVARQIAYFAPCFPAPEWRAQFAERVATE